MDDDLTVEAVKALRSAAERLGVDPFHLARFLSNGRLSEILDLLGQPSLDPKRRLELAEEYLAFLDRQIEVHEGRRPSGRKGGS